MKNKNTKNVLLVNLGGPRNADEVYPFLYDLLTDPYMIDTPMPAWFQKFLFTRIAKKRAPIVAKKYESMGFGGGSPIVKETQRQVVALQELLQKKYNHSNWKVSMAMTCGFPNVRDLSVEELTPSATNIIIPLYPQFSRSTTMSFARIVQKLMPQNNSQKTGRDLPEVPRVNEEQFDRQHNVKKNNTNPYHANRCLLSSPYVLSEFYDHPHFVEAVSCLIFDFLAGIADVSHFINPNQSPKINPTDCTLLFSAHGIPMRLIKKGDQYQKSVEKNVSLLKQSLRQKGFEGSVALSYQSRLGRGKWTAPSTIDKLKQLGADGVESVCIYPISFVSDHLETLEEIEVELREVAHESGIKDFIRIPALGTWPRFIEFLADEVVQLQKGSQVIGSCLCNKLGGESSLCTL